MLRGNRNRQFGLMLHSSMQCRIHRHFLVAHIARPDLWCTFLAWGVGSGAEHGRLAQGELETAENYGLSALRFDDGHDRDAVTRPVACVCALNDKCHTFKREVADFGLHVDGPGRMQFMLVDDNGSGSRDSDALVSAKETSESSGQRMMIPEKMIGLASCP